MPTWREDAKKWEGQVRKGQEKRRKLFKTKKESLEWEAAERASDWSQPTHSVSLAEWATAYLTHAQRFQQSVWKEKRAAFRHLFCKFRPEKDARRFSPRDALDHVREQKEARTAHAANKDLVHLKAGWNWGIKFMGLHQPNPFLLVDPFPVERVKQYVPPERDFWAVYEAASERDRVLLLAYLHTGARKSELFRLRWSDVDFAASQVTLWTRKRSGGNLEPNALPMTDTLYQALLQHRQGSDSEFVFLSIKTGKAYTHHAHFLIRLCARAGVKYFSYHSIRRLTASILAAQDVPMVTIQAILRHQNLQTTERYIQRIDTLAPALKALEGRAPKNKKPSNEPPRLVAVSKSTD